MINMTIKSAALSMLLLGNTVFAKQTDFNSTNIDKALDANKSMVDITDTNKSIDSAKKSQLVKVDISEEQLVNLAGRQRMLSQRMAKDYFYAGMNINKGNSLKQLKKSLEDFKKTEEILNNNIKDEEIKNLIAFVNMSLDEFISISSEPYSMENGALIMDLSESLLEGSNYIVNALTKEKSTNKLIDIAGKQRMLSQRIGKYYIAYQAGIKDENTITQMKESVKEFDRILNKLKSNTPRIQKELGQVNKMWNIVYKFYLNIEKGGLPIIVFSTTDDITSKMNKVVGMYVEALGKK